LDATMSAGRATAKRKILVVDVGGTHVKLLASGKRVHREFDSGPTLTPRQMVARARKLTADWSYQGVSIGYPGPVLHGRPVADARHLGPGWVGFDFARAFGKPVRLVNDAAMQALGSYTGGRMLFLGLGTGMGSAMIVDGVLEPMELAHLPYKRGKTYEDYVGLRGLRRLGQTRWRAAVDDVIERLRAALGVEYVVVGGGNARLLRSLPKHARIGNNDLAFRGGFLLWKGRAR
jgi:polyphosphate glucokinase